MKQHHLIEIFSTNFTQARKPSAQEHYQSGLKSWKRVEYWKDRQR
jgi:hypothetical protein